MTVTVIGSDFGSWPSLAQVNGQPAVSYYDGLNTNLKFVRQGDLLFTINWIALEP